MHKAATRELLQCNLGLRFSLRPGLGESARTCPMKITRYIVFAAGAIAILASATWFLRNTLIQRISNPLLQEYGLAVTDVSLDALATSAVSIGYLKLVHETGTTIVIEDLALPIGTTSSGSKKYTAKKVSIISTIREDGEPLELGRLIDQFLLLPAILSDSEFSLAEFSLPPYPTVRDLQWVLTDGEQRLSGRVGSVAVSAAVTQIDPTNHTVVFSLPTGLATTPEHSVSASMQQSDHGISLNGTASLNLPAWQPIAKLSGVVPHEIEIESGTAALQFVGGIPYDESRSSSVTADLVPTSPLQLAYAGTAGEVTSIVVESGSSVNLAATFPGGEWSLRQAQASLLVTYGDWTNIPLSVSDLSCKSGPVCSMNTLIAMEAAALPVGRVDRFVLSSAANVVFPDDGLLIDVQPNATLEVKTLSAPGTKVGRIEARLTSIATLEIVDEGWRLAASSLDANFEAISLSDDISITTPLFLENIVVSEVDQVLAAKSGIHAPLSQAALNDQTVALPGFRGEVSLQGVDLAIDLQTTGLHQNGTIGAKHNFDTSTGQLAIGVAAVSFDKQKLSSRISPWRDDWDLTAGTVFVDLQAAWTESDSSLVFDGLTAARIENLAGHYIDTAFVGLSTSLETDYTSATGFAAKPSTITIALIEMGLPVENISSNYTLDLDALAINVENLSMTAFGGVIRADPFSFHTGRNRNTLILRAESIELETLLTLKEFEAIEVSGSIGAELPVTIEGDAITIANGVLLGEAPGGVIRYSPGLETEAADTSSIGLVTRALSNFEYESLTSAVDFSTDGDLNLQLRLTGRNPDLDDSRPVVLNLGVESNIPQMLKSLRAARTVEEILERQLGK